MAGGADAKHDRIDQEKAKETVNVKGKAASESTQNANI